ncbi:ZIP family metal transporter [candidate division WWE3 bacterium]|nr:ZIP family metal transporter [candidate division WWE3 bacterium]
MDSHLIAAIIASFIISLGALIGIMTFWVSDEKLHQWLHILVAFSAGAMIGSAFLHLLPEANQTLTGSELFNWVLISFVAFFIIEKILHWRHCHNGDCDQHTFGTMNLIGDAIHNFIDGLIVVGTFLVDVRLGVITSIAMALHEIPQEIGDFGVLIKSGYSKSMALKANFFVALTAVAGVLCGYFISELSNTVTPYILAFAAGGFIYIAASDLVPEIREEQDVTKSLVSLITFLLGIGLMVLFSFIE